MKKLRKSLPLILVASIVLQLIMAGSALAAVTASNATVTEVVATKYPLANPSATSGKAYGTVDAPVDFAGTTAADYYNNSYSKADNTSRSKSGATGRTDGTGKAYSLEAKNATSTFGTTSSDYLNNVLTLYKVTNTDYPQRTGGDKSVAIFDLKINAGTDAVGLYWIPLWANGHSSAPSSYYLFEDGKLAGSNYSYPAGEWFGIKMELDQKNGVWNVWTREYAEDGTEGNWIKQIADAEIVKDTTHTNDRFGLFLVQETYEGRTAKSGFTVDNVWIYGERWSDTAGIKTPATAVVGENATFSANVDVVAGDEVSFFVDDEEIYSFDAAAKDGRFTYSVDAALSNVNAGEKTFVVKKNGEEVRSASFTLKVKSVYDEAVFVEGISFDSSTKGAQAVVNNTKDAAIENMIAVFAVYDGDMLADVSFEPVTLTAGVNTLPATLDDYEDGNEIRFMLWNDDLVPYFAAFPVE